MTILREHIVKRVTRSSMWPKIRKYFIAVNNRCSSCGKTRGLEVHHKKPFHLFPELELDSGNLITLCSNPRCHLDKGHLGYWKSYNPSVVDDCNIWNKKYKDRP
jgi:5-methylcytosine-specific restriction protein A